ncbi:hypothetical protein HXX76_010645 [Chlamydomonas incerta]|uniref:Fungal lipase-type domain-containing protein n=1 Tax=Chlamydomonas incerta TaxID=51695 RepID=A0A835VVW6_CHLIN|nr:hypothetical protein HXX76_010645 [Chlamydomonas incerta]|eukprot:KAG2429865.1 hypothetical protein HXX76_010645 [Chlamydomonas incerta]
MPAPEDTTLSPSHIAVVIGDSAPGAGHDAEALVLDAPQAGPHPPAQLGSPAGKPDAGAQPAATDLANGAPVSGQARQGAIQAPGGPAVPSGALPPRRDAAAPAPTVAPGVVTAERNGGAAPPRDPLGRKSPQPQRNEDFFAATAEVDDFCTDLPAGGEGSNFKDVVLRIEFISSKEVKGIIISTAVIIGAGIAITVYGKVMAMNEGSSWYARYSSRPKFQDNFLSGTICIGITGIMLLLYLIAAPVLCLRRQRWDARRFRSYLTRITELLAMLTLVAAFHEMVIITYAIRSTCSNLLLCLFTITARGMTLWRGGPLTRWQQMGVAMQHITRFTRRWVMRHAREEEEARRLRQERFREHWRANARVGGKQFREAAGAVQVGVTAAGEAVGKSAGCVASGITVAGGAVGGAVASGVTVAGGAVGGALASLGKTLSGRRRSAGKGGADAPPAPGGQAANTRNSSPRLNPLAAPMPAPPAAPLPPAPAPAPPRPVLPSPSPSVLEVEPAPDASQLPPPPSTSTVPSTALPLAHATPQPAGAALSNAPPPWISALGAVALNGSAGTATAASVVAAAVGAAGPGVLPGPAAVNAAAAAHAGEEPKLQPPGPESGPARTRSGREDGAEAAAAAGQAVDEGAVAEQLYLDGPWWAYLSPVLWLFLPYQLLVALAVWGLSTAVDPYLKQDTAQCMSFYTECQAADPESYGFTAAMLIAEVIYLLVYLTYCYRASAFLSKRSYVKYRQLNINLRVEMRVRSIALLFIVVNNLAQAFYVPKVNVDGVEQRCRYSLDTIFGSWSTVVTLTFLCAALSWLFFPRAISRRPLRALLQRFAWIEADVPRQMARRHDAVPHGSTRDARVLLDKAPMFCYETALKLMYWCHFAYEYDETGVEAWMPLDSLMALYDLQQIEVMRDEQSDTKALLASGPRCCLVVFRGTASLKAACVDLKAYMSPFYDRASYKGVSGLWWSMAVHRGFQWSWTNNDFNRRVVDWVAAYRRSNPQGRVIVTGHSLGGAHATLCTLDLSMALGPGGRGSAGLGVRGGSGGGAGLERSSRAKGGDAAAEEPPLLPQDMLTCYTFGCPRAGNHNFAKVYNMVVRETWNVINGNDVVPLTPKCVVIFLYKHPGLKVVLRGPGDIIVRPSFLENAVMRLPLVRSVSQHLMGSYIGSMTAVWRMALRGKHIDGAVRALLHHRRHDLPHVHDAAIELAELAVTTVMAAAGAAGPPEKVQQALLNAVAGDEEASAAAAAVCHSWNLFKRVYVLERAKRARQRLGDARAKADSAMVASAAAAAAAAVPGGPLVFATLGRNESSQLLVQRQGDILWLPEPLEPGADGAAAGAAGAPGTGQPGHKASVQHQHQHQHPQQAQQPQEQESTTCAQRTRHALMGVLTYVGRHVNCGLTAIGVETGIDTADEATLPPQDTTCGGCGGAFGCMQVRGGGSPGKPR